MSKMKKTRKPGGGRKKLKPEYDAGKNLKEKKTALKKAQKEVATLEAKKAKADAKALKKQRRLKPRVRLRDY